MSETNWVAVLKARGVSPRWAIKGAERSLGPNEGLLFVGVSGLLAMFREVGDKATRTRVLPSVEGEEPWTTAARSATRLIVLLDGEDRGTEATIRTLLQETKPTEVVVRDVRRSFYESGELVDYRDLRGGRA